MSILYTVSRPVYFSLACHTVYNDAVLYLETVSRLQRRGEGTVLALFVELGDPFIWAQRVVSLLKLFAWGIILALGRNALKVVGIVLEAIPGLVRVGETSVETNGLKDEFA